jgi:hypothetical protein
MASLVLNQAALKELMSGPSGLVYQDINRRTNATLRTARNKCPVDEGRLRSSLASEIRVQGSVVVGRVGTNLDYALWVHEGTGIYAGRGYITPKRGKFLSWPVKNNSGQGARRYKGGATAQYAFAKKVKGVPGRPFLRQALEAQNRS